MKNAATLFANTAKAVEVANANASSDPDWTYTVETFENGFAIVKITDEDGFEVGAL